MDEFWEKVKKGAQEASEKAAWFGKTAKIKAEIASLNSSKRGKFIELGEKIYFLYRKEKLSEKTKTEVRDILEKLDGIEKEVKEKTKQVGPVMEKKDMGKKRKTPEKPKDIGKTTKKKRKTPEKPKDIGKTTKKKRKTKKRETKK
ncbi:MAG: hypothetical protein U9Q18_01005 [Caldisericota bacterium]|nr:hypothetical protein [Caldisericota bacterium]